MHAFFQYAIWVALSLLGLLIAPLARILQIGKSRKCPPIKNNLLLKSAKTLAAMIKKKEVTSEEVVRAFIERCQEVDPILNAVVHDRYASALDEARDADLLLNSGADISAKPLFGVPITVKESIAVQGMSNNAGVFHQTGPMIAKKDADSVRGAREAGAIPILVSNTPELCMNWETYNTVMGTTCNPYDTRRTPAGSSGGEAALISSGASLMGIASDIGGSLRLPAMFTGIFGHKPTPGVVSHAGHVPDCSDPDWYKYFTIGPMTRYAEDLPLLLKVISVPNGIDLGLDQKVVVQNLNFYYMEDDGGCITSSRISSDVSEALRKAINHLENNLGVKVKKINLPNMKKSFEVSAGMLLGINGVDNLYTDKTNREKMKSVWPQLLKFLFCASNSTVCPVLYGPIKKIIGDMSKEKYQRLVLINQSLQDEFKELLKDNGVFLYPTFPTVANYHKEILYKLINCSYMMIFNTIGLPVTNCPIGITKDGLPVGIQIVGNQFEDKLTIAVAQEFERAFGGWVPPPSTSRKLSTV